MGRKDDKTWTCKCGAINFIGIYICKSCGIFGGAKMYSEITKLFKEKGINSGAFSLLQDVCYVCLDLIKFEETDKEAREIYVIATEAVNKIIENKKKEKS